MTSRVPVLVVSGFLGSGKTTLVRRLLDDAIARGVRVAVVSNELGALGIDRALLGGGDERYVELEGGCVCCELSDELIEVLETVRREVAPDRIVIETSGVALPYETQLSLWRPPVADWAGDDMAAVVVNAEQLAAGRDLGETFEQQVSAADLLVLNQVDRVPDEALPGLEATLAEIEPDAPVVRTVHGVLDLALLEPPPLDASARSARRAAGPHPHHHEPFEAIGIEVETGIDPAALAARLRELGAVRAKGFVETAAGVRLVQGVGRRIELEPAEAPAGIPLGRVVVIRRGAPDLG